MENNNLENNVVDNVPSNEFNNGQTIISNSNNSEKNNKKNNLKKIAIFLFVFSVILIILGFGLNFGLDAIKENKKNRNKELAKTIFEETEMDEYLKDVLIPGVQLNIDLLDSDVKFMNDVYNNSNIPKYIFMFDTESDASWIYIKFEDYAAEYKKNYNKDLTFSMIDTEMSYNSLIHLKDNQYLFSAADGLPCTKNNVDKCYVNISRQIISERDVKYDALDLKENNIVVGTAILTYNNNNTKSVLKGNFELKYKEENNKYVVDYIKMVSVEEEILARFNS